MSLSHDRVPELRLERLGDRDSRRPSSLGEFTQVAPTLDSASTSGDIRAAYQALNDAVFTAPGATAWLSGLRRALAALLAGGNNPPTHHPIRQDAIHSAQPGPSRS